MKKFAIVFLAFFIVFLALVFKSPVQAAPPVDHYEGRVIEECREDTDGGNTVVTDVQVFPGTNPAYPCGATFISTSRAQDHYVVFEHRWVHYILENGQWIPQYGEWQWVFEVFVGPCEPVVQTDEEAWVCEDNPYAFPTSFTFCVIEGSEEWPAGLSLTLYGNEIIRQKEAGWYEIAPFDLRQFPVGSQLPLTLTNGQPYVTVSYEGDNTCSIED